MRLRRSLFALPLLLGALACSGSDDDAAPAPAWALVRSPEFVNRVIPGERPLAIVSVDGDGTERIDLTGTVSMAGASVTLRPPAITPGEASEVWVSLPATGTETPFEVVVTGTRSGDERTVTIGATAVPGVDDVAGTAEEIVTVFLDELGGSVPGLPTDVADLTGGTPVAGLLVVTHYAWFTDGFEIGLAWHVMIAPDDWSELTVRPRDEVRPTQAFRLDSWSTALAGGEYAITEIEPPIEVTR